MRKAPLLFFIVVFMASCNNSQAAEITISIVDMTTSKIRVAISNESNTALTVPLKFIPEDYYIRFEIIDAKGEKVQFIGKEIKFYPTHADYLAMEPHSSFEQSIELRKFYAMSNELYSIKAIYEVDELSRSEEGLWSGLAVSTVEKLDLR